MAHYALINQQNIVVQVITGIDETEIQIDNNGSSVGGSSEAWEDFYSNLPWYQGLICKRTSYNGKIRKQYAGIGFTYDFANDIFIAPQPYPSWNLDENFDWQPPKPRPDGEFWVWDEEVGEWFEKITVA
jgi:hypothetical protein